MNSDYDIIVTTHYEGSCWVRVESKNKLMKDLKDGNLQVYETWLQRDEQYNPINFSVIGMKFNDKMQATSIELEMW